MMIIIGIQRIGLYILLSRNRFFSRKRKKKNKLKNMIIINQTYPIMKREAEKTVIQRATNNILYIHNIQSYQSVIKYISSFVFFSFC